LATEWQMPPSTGQCAAGDRAFEPGDAFRAYLFATPGGYERRDYCLACAPPAGEAPIASWKARHAAPSAPRRRALDVETVYALFEGLAADGPPQQRQLRFVLALLLWRRRVLKLTDTVQEGEQEHWRFAAPSRGDLHVVERPPLAEEEIERLSAQLESLISGQVPIDAVISDASGVANA